MGMEAVMEEAVLKVLDEVSIKKSSPFTTSLPSNFKIRILTLTPPKLRNGQPPHHPNRHRHPSQALALHPSNRPRSPPSDGEILVRNEWAASTPFDLHRADGGVLIDADAYPYLSGGGGAAGTVIALGAGDVKGLRVGDRVAAWAPFGGKQANHQDYVTIPAHMASKVPKGISLQEAVTVPANLVTVVYTATTDLRLELPWPKPEGWTPREASEPILLWGASSSVGIFALQVFRHWGYTNLIAVSSGKHHEYLKTLGATTCFDYTKPGVVDAMSSSHPTLPYIIDCIGSVSGTLAPLSKIAQRGSRVAVMLPIVIRDPTDTQAGEYSMNPSEFFADAWAEDVELIGVRTMFYLQNPFLRENLPSDMVPTLLAQGVIKPNKYRIVEGATKLERAQKALALLKSKAVSGERLVWRVSEQ
ncbi:Trans-enoyl reductase lepG-like protein [Cladobotryum mycophilum]|uniref:Trans-enoyl reductase lepG-like protein n=1 Tax=Cladobotryum mycophilum TaxID=491253 RepID=A0ABR0S5B6_9HYPO